MRYYLAYGSNMVLDQMKTRCKDAVLVSKEYISGYELFFKKTDIGTFLDLVKTDGNTKVPVFIWEVSLEDEKNLDEYENYPKSYIKKDIKWSKGTAFVYFVNEDYNELGIPKDEYLLPILETYKDNGYDVNILLKQLKGGK